MNARHHTRLLARVLGSAALAAGGIGTLALTSTTAPPAAAAQCPDVEVVFARGTGEPAGPGPTGQAFIDALRSRLPDKSMDVYSVNYPATDQWATGVDGIRDAGAHVVDTANTCPNTKMVLGGYSQGAAVMGFVTSAEVPEGVDPATVPKPLDPSVAESVSAVVLYALPNVRAMNFLNEPPVAIGPLYRDKTVQLCVPEDAVCSLGLDFGAHNSYANNPAVINQGADFAAARINGVPVPPAPEQPAIVPPAPPAT
ncbi:cutinase family protein [Mycobacterium sp. 1274756.6]|uniref:cutinase family protein n=1 Tax=Mycobacterium sp. 1274756.6 TaxID=1834076 RepID=UPI0007FCBF6A|nr:cutinase family protein [Mycobacterium sp. 1274756.6]OBJ69693.1 cutinase [Mycobacterium sp. 1274756.6]